MSRLELLCLDPPSVLGVGHWGPGGPWGPGPMGPMGPWGPRAHGPMGPPMQDPGSMMPMQDPGSLMPKQDPDSLGVGALGPFGFHLGPILFGTHLGPFFILFGAHLGPILGPWPILAYLHSKAGDGSTNCKHI